MEIDLSEEQRLLRDTCREFAEKELRPNAKKWDREHRFPADAVKKACELGLGGVAVPAEWGGAGMDNVSLSMARYHSVTTMSLRYFRTSSASASRRCRSTRV